MNARQFFVGDDGRLRPLWRIIAFVAVSFASIQVVAILVGPLISEFFLLVGVRGVSTDTSIGALGALVATAIALRYLDKRSWSDVWLGREAARPALWIIGFAIGAAAIGFPIVALIGAHWLKYADNAAGSWLGAALRVSLYLLPAALFEELITRGYVLSVLRESWGWVWAISATSIGFALLHLRNNGATVESLLLVLLAGFFLAVVLYATRSLYAAWMAHFAWNWTMAVAFHRNQP